MCSWLDPSALLPKFQRAMKSCPVRELSQAQEFKRAELDAEAIAKRESETKRALAMVAAEERRARRLEEMAGKRVSKQEKILLECVARGETPKERTMRMAREHYHRTKSKRIRT